MNIHRTKPFIKLQLPHLRVSWSHAGFPPFASWRCCGSCENRVCATWCCLRIWGPPPLRPTRSPPSSARGTRSPTSRRRTRQWILCARGLCPPEYACKSWWWCPANKECASSNHIQFPCERVLRSQADGTNENTEKPRDWKPLRLCNFKAATQKTTQRASPAQNSVPLCTHLGCKHISKKYRHGRNKSMAESLCTHTKSAMLHSISYGSRAVFRVTKGLNPSAEDCCIIWWVISRNVGKQFIVISRSKGCYDSIQHRCAYRFQIWSIDYDLTWPFCNLLIVQWLFISPYHVNQLLQPHVEFTWETT